MGKIHKLTKGGQTIYPATVTDAVVNPNTRKSLTAELAGLSLDIQELSSFVSNEKDYPNDNRHRESFNRCVKALLFTVKPQENERFVISYFTQWNTGSTFYLGVTAYNVVTGQTRIVSPNTLSYSFNKMNTIYSDTSKENEIGYVYARQEDYTIAVNNTGQGLSRMPYANSACFDENAQALILKYHIKKQQEETQRQLDNKEELQTLMKSLGVKETDITKMNYANSAIKGLYLLNKPDGNRRIVLSYLRKLNSSYQLGLNLYDPDSGTDEIISITTGLTYPFDKITPIYNNPTDKVIVGYAYASLSDWTGDVANQGEGLRRLPYCGPLCYDLYKQPIVSNYFIQEQIDGIHAKLDDVQVADNVITVWGDSITWGSAATANNLCYTAILRNLISEHGFVDKVVNCGVGGEAFQNILVRQGALGFYLADDIVLPASATEKVEIQRSNNWISNKRFRNTYFGQASSFSLLLQGELGRDNQQDQYRTVNPVYVNGIECTMKLEGTQQTNIIYLSPGHDLDAPVTIKSGTYLYPHGNTFKSKTIVLSIGTNDGFTVQNDGIIDMDASINRYIEMTDLAIEKSNTRQFIVCSPYGGAALRKLQVSGLEKLEAALARRYGNRHFNWRKYLIQYGLSDAGISPTDEDIVATNKGEIPPSLLSDEVHPNDAGHRVIGTRLFWMMYSLGYLTAK